MILVCHHSLTFIPPQGGAVYCQISSSHANLHHYSCSSLHLLPPLLPYISPTVLVSLYILPQLIF